MAPLVPRNHQAAAFDVAEQGAIEFHYHVAGIGEGGAHGIRRLALLRSALTPVAVARVGMSAPMYPVRHIHPVDEEVGHGAAAEIPIPAPVGVLVGVERPVGGGAQEALPIELGQCRCAARGPSTVLWF